MGEGEGIQRISINPACEGSRCWQSDSDTEGFRPWAKRAKVSPKMKSDCSQPSPNPIRRREHEESEGRYNTFRWIAGEQGESHVGTEPKRVSQSAMGERLYCAQAHPSERLSQEPVRIPEAIRAYLSGYYYPSQRVGYQSELAVYAPDAIQHCMPYGLSHPARGQYPHARFGSAHSDAVSWPVESGETSLQYWAEELPFGFAVSSPAQGQGVGSIQMHESCGEANAHSSLAQSSVTSELRSSDDDQGSAPCVSEWPLDTKLFHSKNDADQLNQILQTIERSQDADSNCCSNETQLGEEDRHDLTNDIRSLLADMAITASIKNLLIAVGGMLQLESGLRIHVTPSFLIQLADHNPDLFGMDQNLLYFDTSLSPVLPNHNDQEIPDNCGTDSLTIDNEPQGRALHQNDSPTDTGQHRKSRSPSPTSTQNNAFLPELADSIPCPQSKCPLSESAEQGSPPSKSHNLPDARPGAPAGVVMTSSTDSEHTMASPIIDDGSDSDNEPIINSKAERRSRNREPNFSNSQSSNSNDIQPISMNSNGSDPVPPNSNDSEHICSTCGKQFGRRFGLQMHYRTHSGERPYECQVCQKRFAHRSHLTRHRRTHTGERNHVCYICDKRFTENGSVIRHIRRRHPDVDPDSVRLRTRRRKS